MRCTISQIYFDKEMLTVCLQTVNITRMTNTYCCVYSVETPDDDGQ